MKRLKDMSLIEVLIVVSIAFTGFAIVVGGVATVKETERLMKQCIADGKKEYECKLLLNPPAQRIEVHRGYGQ